MKVLANVLAIIAMICLLIGAFASCRSSGDYQQAVAKDTIEIVRIDTVYKVDRHEVDSLAKCLKQAQDSMKFYRDSIEYIDYINARRIEKIQYYINICEKKSTNKQFFYGWIKRTMTE